MFKLSKRSISRLDGVDPQLTSCVHRAITLTKIDFGVSEGLRSLKRQEELVAKGASQTMKSKHLDGKAVDLVAYIGSKVSWELNMYDDIADAMKEASIEVGIQLRWGAAWHLNDIRAWDGTMETLMTSYIDLRRSQGRRPFIDAPHFEIL
jgi:peptidoglycan L-alanyl-D-glutamate endopeptidase CwlK